VSTPDDSSDSPLWNQRLLAEARKLRGDPEPARRRGAFRLIKERLRVDWEGQQPGPPPAMLDVLTAAYDDPDKYFRLFVDLEPERAGITPEEFLAVHASGNFAEIERHQAMLENNPFVRRILGKPRSQAPRERLRRLMDDVDGGYLIGPELADYLRRTAVKPPEPATELVTEITPPEAVPEATPAVEAPEATPGLATTPAVSGETAQLPEVVQVSLKTPTEADLDACIRASAEAASDGKTSRNQLRRDAPKWFALHRIRPVTQDDVGRRLDEKQHTGLRRGTGKRSH
jgi:hypothetical protein